MKNLRDFCKFLPKGNLLYMHGSLNPEEYLQVLGSHDTIFIGKHSQSLLDCADNSKLFKKNIKNYYKLLLIALPSKLS